MEELINYDLNIDPILSFEKWFSKAMSLEENPTAFTLATADRQGNPSARILLYKGHDPVKGFKFYGHTHSAKGQDLASNPKAAMVFYWHHSERQVRIKGSVVPMSLEETAEYFYSRDRESQIASFISDQSRPIGSRAELENLFEDARVKFSNQSQVDIPPHWSGYYLKPENFEFFVYGAHRLNDRFSFSLENGLWLVTRLQP